jgi:hypothetical protein
MGCLPPFELSHLPTANRAQDAPAAVADMLVLYHGPVRVVPFSRRAGAVSFRLSWSFGVELPSFTVRSDRARVFQRHGAWGRNMAATIGSRAAAQSQSRLNLDRFGPGSLKRPDSRAEARAMLRDLRGGCWDDRRSLVNPSDGPCWGWPWGALAPSRRSHANLTGGHGQNGCVCRS